MGHFKEREFFQVSAAAEARSAEGQLRHHRRIAAMENPGTNAASNCRRIALQFLLRGVVLARGDGGLHLLPPRRARELKIQKFSAEIFVQQDSALNVTETIEANFIGSWHGLYRSIPVEYVTPQGFNYSLFVRFDGATDAAGQPLKMESSRDRHYLKWKNLRR